MKTWQSLRSAIPPTLARASAAALLFDCNRICPPERWGSASFHAISHRTMAVTSTTLNDSASRRIVTTDDLPPSSRPSGSTLRVVIRCVGEVGSVGDFDNRPRSRDQPAYRRRAHPHQLLLMRYDALITCYRHGRGRGSDRQAALIRSQAMRNLVTIAQKVLLAMLVIGICAISLASRLVARRWRSQGSSRFVSGAPVWIGCWAKSTETTLGSRALTVCEVAAGYPWSPPMRLANRVAGCHVLRDQAWRNMANGIARARSSAM